MQTTIKKSIDTKEKREKISNDDAAKPQDDKVKKVSTNLSTPRNYLPKSSTADIYGINKKNTLHSVKAPKKSPHNSNLASNVSPMKDQLKSSPSSSSFRSNINSRHEKKIVVQKKVDTIINKHSSIKVKDFNVTVNSPVAKRKLYTDKDRSFIKETPRREKDYSPNVKRKLNLEKEKSFIKDSSRKVNDSSSLVKRRQDLKTERSLMKEDSKIENEKEGVSSSKNERHRIMSKDVFERQRTKTRTLEENEVKILTPDVVDNNVEMLKLSKKLSAKPKAYYIDLDTDKAINMEKVQRPKTPSDEEVSYEDDFESYESDFDSYHSSSPSEHNVSDDKGDEDDAVTTIVEMKEAKDEEKMLDSGSFDLRDQRSANKTKPALDFILETAEGGEDKRTSLTDEGFQEMSSSSAVSSIKTVHVDVLDRPLFIDFTKSKQNKKKKRVNDLLQLRAKDLLSMITLHEMSYNLFEMKPISYDLFMATFGRSNYQQVAVQTFDDGITEEIQTDEVDTVHKWTQHPIAFTKNDICFNTKIDKRKYSNNIEDYLTKFAFLTTQRSNNQNVNEDINESYKTNPLRIYFEQKDGVGQCEMLPFETYKSKLKNNQCNTERLSNFLKKMENKVFKVLNYNSGNTELSEMKISRYPFSKGFVSISIKNVTDEKKSFLNQTKITQMIYSETKSNMILTVHRKTDDIVIKKCMICLWDIGVARREPLKILTAIDNVVIGKFRGASDGLVVAALEDSSVHLWDLSEDATWRTDVATEEKSKELVEINEGNPTPFERDREWNQKNSHLGMQEDKIQCPLQACAFTNSASNMKNGVILDSVVGLELIGNKTVSRESQKVIGQIAALQRSGVLTIWSIIQEKSNTIPPDIGKAFWSKIKLEKVQTINIVDHIDISIKDTNNSIEFNLNTAKKRLQSKKSEKNIYKINVCRPKSAFEIERPYSAASVKNKKVLPVHKGVYENWESGIVCYDLKVIFWRNEDNFLVAKNWGEVMCCRRTLGVVKVSRLCVTADVSSVTRIEVSPQKLPYFLAATDTGIIALVSLVENRVLLTLDCRNIPTQEMTKCQSDYKGRYIGTVSTKKISDNDSRFGTMHPISSVSWSRINPCCIYTTLEGHIVSWELSYSDIYAKSAFPNSAVTCAVGDNTLALLTPEGEVHVHKLTNENKTQEFIQLFEKYVALL